MKDNSNYEIIENDAELEKLCTDSVELINYARNIIVKHVNIVQIMTYYSLGRWIVETQQMGEKRAKYGSKVIKTLSENLQKEFGKGFSEDTLKNARKFYLTYKERISETVFSLFAIEKSETVFSFFEKEPPFIVSWSHYLQLMRIENEAERSFYEIETAKTGWGVRTLQRQYNSSLYERLALSRDKEGVLRLASEGNVITKPEDIIKQPTVLEFLGMEEKAKYSETDLETALINKLQKFLLELGKGYLFEARQKRFTYDEDNFYVDLVFYNRLLRCYVLIDLKVDKLTHQDIGQALLNDGVINNEQLQSLIIGYQSENELYDADMSAETKDIVDHLVENFFVIAERPLSPGELSFLHLLFNDLVRFIGDDFSPVRPELCKEYPTNYCIRQQINGKFSIRTYIDMPESTCIAFASRYVNEDFHSFDEYVQSSLEDFLNLHNGLFNVNMSNEQGLELQLDVPNVVTDELVTFEHEAYMLPIVYSFGTIHFIFELIHNEL